MRLTAAFYICSSRTHGRRRQLKSLKQSGCLREPFEIESIDSKNRGFSRGIFRISITKRQASGSIFCSRARPKPSRRPSCRRCTRPLIPLRSLVSSDRHRHTHAPPDGSRSTTAGTVSRSRREGRFRLHRVGDPPVSVGAVAVSSLPRSRSLGNIPLVHRSRFRGDEFCEFAFRMG